MLPGPFEQYMKEAAMSHIALHCGEGAVSQMKVPAGGSSLQAVYLMSCPGLENRCTP